MKPNIEYSYRIFPSLFVTMLTPREIHSKKTQSISKKIQLLKEIYEDSPTFDAYNQFGNKISLLPFRSKGLDLLI